ncbi:MAG: DivIVA domain-containing protein [Acutalibacteraceae bacterium]
MFNNKLFVHQFASAGKNKYYASEVESFIKDVSEKYDKLYKAYRALEKKLETWGPALDDYNKNKNAVFGAVVRAEQYYKSVEQEALNHSAELVSQASEKAEALLLSKQAEAESYYYTTTHDADEQLKKLQKDISVLQKQASEQEQEYVAKATATAEKIIKNAKVKAAEIIDAANDDVRSVKEQSALIIAQTQAQLADLKVQIKKYKQEILSVVETIRPTVESIQGEGNFDFRPTEIDTDPDKLADKLPDFKLNIRYQDDEELTKDPDIPAFFEDVSSESGRDADAGENSVAPFDSSIADEDDDDDYQMPDLPMMTDLPDLAGMPDMPDFPDISDFSDLSDIDSITYEPSGSESEEEPEEDFEEPDEMTPAPEEEPPARKEEELPKGGTEEMDIFDVDDDDLAGFDSLFE